MPEPITEKAPTTPPNTPSPEAARQLAALEITTDDYKSLVTPEPTPKDEPEAVEPKAADPEPEAKTDEPPTKESTPEMPPEGTPDKDRQRRDQKIASIEDRLEKAVALIEEKGAATKADKARVEALKDELATLAEDPDEHAGLKRVASRALKHDSEIAELRKELERERAERTWEKEERTHEGVNVREVWDKACKDAAKEVAEEAADADLTKAQADKMAWSRAKSLYAKRVEEASKSVQARATAPKPKPPTTPGNGRVTVQHRSPSPPASINPLADDFIGIEDYRRLVEPN